MPLSKYRRSSVPSRELGSIEKMAFQPPTFSFSGTPCSYLEPPTLWTTDDAAYIHMQTQYQQHGINYVALIVGC